MDGWMNDVVAVEIIDQSTGTQQLEALFSAANELWF
jgi:hypothetical protein